MKKVDEQRKEKRLRYDWPVRFAKGFAKTLFRGKMVDVCSCGGAFTCQCNEKCLNKGQEITTLFSVPQFGHKDSYHMAHYRRVGRILRIDNIDNSLYCVAIQFTEPLFFKPGEHNISESEAPQKLKDSLT